MIVVLAVLSLVAALVIARGPQRSTTLELRQASANVAGALRVARSRAIAGNRTVGVLFEPRTARVQVGGAPARSLPPGIAMALTVPRDQGTSIVFLPDGSATGGEVVLSSHGLAARVGVEWLSGRVSVADAR